MHVKNVRKWIYRFNKHGIEGILEKKKTGRKPRINEKIVKEIINIAKTPPHKLGLPFSNWSLRKLENYLISKKKIKISYGRIRQLLLKHGFKFWKTKQEIISKDPNYEAKMLRIKRLLKKPNCIVLFQDEKKVPIKLYSGYEWKIKRRTITLNPKSKIYSNFIWSL
jgi:transposase